MLPIGKRMIASGMTAALLAFGIPCAISQDQTGAVTEVYNLIRTNLAGLTPAEIEKTAITGMISGFGPRVQLAAKRDSATTATPVVKTCIYEDEFGYIRVGSVTAGLPAAVRAAFEGFTKSNKLSGLVIDLRYAGGDDYAAAADTADLFLQQERPLLDWGAGVVKSKAKDNAIRMPVALLVNRQTSAAAEALASVMRQTGTGLLLGNKTPGNALISKEFKLQGGEALSIAITPVKMGDGSPVAPQGVQPDILVELAAEAESGWYSNAFATLSQGTGARLTGTNATRRTRFGEADLVRNRREGLPMDTEAHSAAAAESDKLVVRDPALARALDVLKGLALARPGKS